MKRKITQWALTTAVAVTLVACATSVRYASSTDDIYYSPKTASAGAVKNAVIEDAEIAQLKSQTQAAIRENEKMMESNNSEVRYNDDNHDYTSILSDSYEDSYERRLKGYENPNYGMENRIRIINSNDWMLVTAFDPDFYNIIVMGDEIWVEPKYITRMFSPVRSTINLNLGWSWGWNRYRYYDPWTWNTWGWNSWGWNSWGWNSWGWNSYWDYPYYGYSWYDPWYSPYYYGGYGPYYYGWNYGWNGYWNNRNYWGLGVPNDGNIGYTYNRRNYNSMNEYVGGARRPISSGTTGTINENSRRTSSYETTGTVNGESRRRPISSGATSSEIGNGRRTSSNMELVTTGRRPNTAGTMENISTDSRRSGQTNYTGRVPASENSNSGNIRRGFESSNQYSTGREPSQRYTRPVVNNDYYNGRDQGSNYRRQTETQVRNNYNPDTRRSYSTETSSSSRSVNTNSSYSTRRSNDYNQSPSNNSSRRSSSSYTPSSSSYSNYSSGSQSRSSGSGSTGSSTRRR